MRAPSNPALNLTGLRPTGYAPTSDLVPTRDLFDAESFAAVQRSYARG
jgi:hypothetical protein